MNGQEQDKLNIVWTTGERNTALNMVLKYALHSKMKKWWKKITLLVWGDSEQLLVDDKELQEYLTKVQKEGVEVIACMEYANKHGIADRLKGLGVNVFYTGQLLTDWIQSDKNVVTY